jgi:lipid A ethanolaminephosphotransferase
VTSASLSDRLRLPALSVESLLLLASLFFALACNVPFWKAALAGREFGDAGTLRYAASLLVLLAGLHYLPLALLAHRRWVKPLLGVVFVLTALVVHFMGKYGIYLDPSMMRNALQTNVAEARELLSWDMLPALLLYAGLPLLALRYLRVMPAASVRRALLRRTLALVLVALATVAALLVSFQDIASLMRNHKDYRYLIAPANLFYSTARAASVDAEQGRAPLLPVGTDARLGERMATKTARPVLFIVVVGETARAANWGLSGYPRQTTPGLAALDVINFREVISCGTNTEVSLPCLFSPFGRHDYDEAKIRASESLLHVLDRAGLGIEWRDNQSGCKGVCAGLPEWRIDVAAAGPLCRDGQCFDEALLQGLARPGSDAGRNRVVVLHPLGNHGPAYFKRYPPEFARYLPACENQDLARCSIDEIINAYDNALLYTDHVLSRAIAELKALSATHDTALIYVSDHGESLGENKLFLHGMPYAIAPQEQTRVPMVMWFSPGYARRFALDVACLKARAGQPANHDNVFHTLLGLLDVRTNVYAAGLDLSANCRPTTTP